MDAPEMGWHFLLTTIIVVTTINMVEIGNLNFSGDALNPLLIPSDYDISDTIWVSPN
jgi:hypothetical protein